MHQDAQNVNLFFLLMQIIYYLNKHAICLHPLDVGPNITSNILIETTNGRPTVLNPPLTQVLVCNTKLLLRTEPTLEEIHRVKGNIVKDDVIIILAPRIKIKDTRHENMRPQTTSPFSLPHPTTTPDYERRRSIYILPHALCPLTQNYPNVPIIISRFKFLLDGPIMMVR